MADVHVVPIKDLIEHDNSTEDACVCGPAILPVPREDGSFGWIAQHHSLDGREFREG